MWTILLYEYDYQNSSIKAWSRPDLDEDTKNVLYSELYDNMSPFYKVSEVIFFYSISLAFSDLFASFNSKVLAHGVSDPSGSDADKPVIFLFYKTGFCP